VIRYFIEHPTAANILMVVLLMLGVVSLPELKRETFPDIHAYEVQTTVIYPGASARDVEQGICLKLEDATDGISYLKEKRCDARDNLATFTTKMKEGGHMPQFVQDIKDAVDSISDFPANTEAPVVKETGLTSHVISIGVAGDMPQSDLKHYAEHLKKKLLALNDIAMVQIDGFSNHQLRIEIPEYRLRMHGLSINQIANIISRQTVDLPAGDIKTDVRNYAIRINDQRKTPDELKDIVVLRNTQGAELRLGDIAHIYNTFEKDEERIEINGKPAALLSVRKNKQDDGIQVKNVVEEFVDNERKRLPKGVELTLTNDFVSIAEDRLQLLMSNGWQGLVLVFLAMWLFFSFKYSFWVAMGLPVSFMASFMTMMAMGMSINMISMVALLISLGILMDDAIVLAESIATEVNKRRNEKNALALEDVVEATHQGVKKVARGVLSSFTTTVLVFGSLMFIVGDLGQILKVIPIVLISVISVSLLEAFLILPHHLLHASQQVESEPSAFKKRFSERFDTLRDAAFGLCQRAISVRYLTLGIVVSLFLVSVAMLSGGLLKFRAFPALEGNIIEARLLMPQGTPLQETQRQMTRIQNALEQVNAELSAREGQPLVQSVRVRFGYNPDAYEAGPHIATLSADLLNAEVRISNMDDIRQLWRKHIGAMANAVALQLKEPSLGPSGRAIEIRLQGDDLAQLDAAAQRTVQAIKTFSGTYDIQTDLRPGKPEFTLKLKDGAYALGIDSTTVASQLRSALTGQKIDSVQLGSESYDVTVQYDLASRNDLSDFDRFPIVNDQNGAQIPLQVVADIQRTRSWSRIHRIDGLTTVTVTGDVNTRVGNVQEILTRFQQQAVPAIQADFPDVKFDFAGEVANSAETGSSMGSKFVLSLLGIFLLLSLQFRNYVEPIVVMTAIPLALIGVVWGHMLMGLDLSMPSMMGFVSLAGIVVNNSILLVEFTKQGVAAGQAFHDAAAEAAKARFRAIFITTLTTTAGMVPLLFETSLQAQVLIPLVCSIVFGLLVSTVLVLILVPSLLVILEDLGFKEDGK